MNLSTSTIWPNSPSASITACPTAHACVAAFVDDYLKGIRRGHHAHEFRDQHLGGQTGATAQQFAQSSRFRSSATGTAGKAESARARAASVRHFYPAGCPGWRSPLRPRMPPDRVLSADELQRRDQGADDRPRSGSSSRVLMSRVTSTAETRASPVSRYPAPDSRTNSALIEATPVQLVRRPTANGTTSLSWRTESFSG